MGDKKVFRISGYNWMTKDFSIGDLALVKLGRDSVWRRILSVNIAEKELSLDGNICAPFTAIKDIRASDE